MLRSFRAVTLTELLITVVLVGIIAGFGVPNYTKSREKSIEKEAVDTIRIIAEAVNLYRLRDGNLPTFNMVTVSDINTTLDLGIIKHQDIDYDCTISPPSGYTCHAVTSQGWNIHHNVGTDGTIHCHDPACPSWCSDCVYPKFME